MALLDNIINSVKAKKSKLNIIISVNNNEDKIVLPIVLAELPEIDVPQANSTFQAITGDINVIGTMGLRQLTINSFFPVNKNYSFIRNQATYKDGWKYIEWIEKYRKQYIPFRLFIAETSGDVRLNIACTIDSFKYHQNIRNDIDYSITFREYKFIDSSENRQAAEGEIPNE